MHSPSREHAQLDTAPTHALLIFCFTYDPCAKYCMIAIADASMINQIHCLVPFTVTTFATHWLTELRDELFVALMVPLRRPSPTPALEATTRKLALSDGVCGTYRMVREYEEHELHRAGHQARMSCTRDTLKQQDWSGVDMECIHDARWSECVPTDSVVLPKL